MPNWAYTSYRIVGKKEEVQDLYSKIQQLQNMEEPLEPNGFGNLWLGCLVTILGGDWNKIYCRGHIIDYSLDDSVLSIDTETAWSEMQEVRQFIQQIYPSLEILYYEEEPGWGIYQTNDHDKRFFSFRYILDDLEGDGPEYYDDTDSLFKAASEIFGKELKTMADLENIVENSDGYSLHYIKVVND